MLMHPLPHAHNLLQTAAVAVAVAVAVTAGQILSAVTAGLSMSLHTVRFLRPGRGRHRRR
ncbi:hypothetical protein [Peterkaempfera bronchialis]|uniref:Uncharacterized protein n=1 Tax=Peterkaempfera bronchialis TaxID=2126346 RepID=A0A345T2Z1_9ACTN|nr:hypothetical protein [Peterkaempfera bronchialis]AXI80346.1 hypothetical protein C7M71_026055 [Peterkaempfera bronchialis]